MHIHDSDSGAIHTVDQVTPVEAMGSDDRLRPLELNDRTGEPFLRLPAPFQNIIITPPRSEDVPSIVRALNDPRVYKTLSGPPFPYLEEHATAW
jgi:hypothetical protein